MKPAHTRWIKYPASNLIKAVTLKIDNQKEVHVKCQNCDVLVTASDVNENLICKKCLQKQRVA